MTLYIEKVINGYLEFMILDLCLKKPDIKKLQETKYRQLFSSFML